MPITQTSRKRSTTTRARKGGTKAARRPSRAPRHDAIAILKDDHRAVEELFEKFERAGNGAAKQKRKLVDQMIVELSQHASIEEQVLYPDTPPVNVVAAPIASALDHAREVGRDVVERIGGS